MSFIVKNNKSYYLARKVYDFGLWSTKLIRRATTEEIKTYHEMKKHHSAIVTMICDNPFCDNKIKITRRKKIRLNTEDPIKGRLEFIYCCKNCRTEHCKALKGEGK